MGNDFKTFYETTRQLCAQKCKHFHYCQAFVYNFNSQECTLKTEGNASGDSFRNNLFTDFYIKVHVDGFKRYGHSYYLNEDLDNFAVKNRDFCGQKCNQTPFCRAFVFQLNNNWCYLKKDAVTGWKHRSYKGKLIYDLYIKN